MEAPVESATAKRKSWFKTLISGDYGLAKTFWIYNVIGIPLIFVVVTAVIVQSGYIVPELASSTVVCIYLIIALTAHARATGKYQGERIWRWLADLYFYGWLAVIFGPTLYVGFEHFLSR